MEHCTYNNVLRQGIVASVFAEYSAHGREFFFEADCQANHNIRTECQCGKLYKSQLPVIDVLLGQKYIADRRRRN